MNATTPALSLHSLLARLEASDCIAVDDHEFDGTHSEPWIAMQLGAIEVTVNLDLTAQRVTVRTADCHILYSKSVAANWEKSVFDFLNVLALAIEPEESHA
nr:hypothetical protein [Variovorax boronicumulans]